MSEERNAVIESARLEIERGLLTAWLMLDYGGAGQGFGGWCERLAKTAWQNYPSPCHTRRC